MRRFTSSWLGTLSKLGFKRRAKLRRPRPRRCAIEQLEAKQVLTVLYYLGENESNCPDDCPCSCAQVGATSGGAATTQAGKLSYSSHTQANPVMMFALDAYSYPIMTELKAELTVGDNAPIDVYFGAVSLEVQETGMAVFGIQIDASSMSSGVYEWQLDLSFYDGDVDPYYAPTYVSNSDDPNLLPLHVVNHDESQGGDDSSQYGNEWSMSDDARLFIQDSLPGQPDGIALLTGNNDVTWFYDPTDGDYAREANPTNFSDLHKDDNGTDLIATDDVYLLTDPKGTVSTFDYQGLLQTVVDRNGNPLATYTYGTSGDWNKIVDIEDVAGRHTHFTYSSGLLTSVTDFYGTAGAQTTQYDYYPATNLLLHMIEPDPDDAGPLANPTTTYHYNGSGLLDSVIDPRGLETTVGYDQTSRVNSIIERCGGEIAITSMQSLVAVDLVTNSSDPSDWADLMAYLPLDFDDSDVKAAFEADRSETRVVFGEEMKILRDNYGNIRHSQDADGTVTRVDGNVATGLVTVTQPNPNVPSAALTTSYSYDTSGRITGRSNPIGFESWSYGAFGQLENYSNDVKSIAYELDESNGNVDRMTNFLDVGDDLITEYTYTDGLGDTTIKGLIETITDPNDNETLYTYNPNGLVATITYANGNIADEYTEEYEYDNRDRLEFFHDGRGNITQYVYDNLDRLIQRIDPDPDGAGTEYESPVWNFRYDPSGNQTYVIDPMGNATEYVYDERDRLSTEIKHEGFVPPPVRHWKLDEVSGTTASDSSDSGATGTVTGTTNWVAGHEDNAFQFNGSTKIEASGLMGTPEDVTIAGWANLTTADTYGATLVSLGDYIGICLDLAGSTRAFFYNGEDWEFATVADTFAGEGWHFFAATFDDANNSLKLYIDGELAATWSTSNSIVYSGLGSNTVLGRHGAGHPDFDFTGTIDDVSIFEYALTAAQIAQLYAPDPTTKYDWDCNGNLTQTIDPMGHVTDYLYDELNRLITRTDADPDNNGALPRPVTNFTYNSLGWLTSVTDPESNVTFYQYDEMGRRTKDVKITGDGLLGDYRTSGDAVVETRVDEEIDFSDESDFAGVTGLGNGFVVTWTGAIYLDFADDPFGEAEFFINSTDSAEMFIDGDSVATHTGTGSMEEDSGDALTLAAGWHLVTITLNDTESGDSGLIVSYKLNGGSKDVIPVTALGTTEITTTVYDDAGRVQSLTDPLGNTTSWLYDEVDRVTSESIVVDSVPLTRTYEYEGTHLTRKTDCNDRITEYDYDGLNRVKTETWLDALDDLIWTINYAFDDAGNLTSISDDNATYVFEYDDLDRQTDAAHLIAGLTASVYLSRDFDDASQLTSVRSRIGIAPDGVNYDYRNDYVYDAQGRLTTLIQTEQSDNAVADKRIDFTYNPDNQLASLARYAGTTTANPVATTDFGYDALGRTSLIHHLGIAPGSAFEQEHRYAYDDASRLTSYADLIDGIMADYGYDRRNQLVSADDSGLVLPDEAYTYDNNGNRELVDNYAGAAQDYEVDPYNRIVTDGTFTNLYDDEGNRTARFVDGNTNGEWETTETGLSYSWDHRNRLASVVLIDSNQVVMEVDYEYDAFNQLIFREMDPDGATGSEDHLKTSFIYDNGQVVLQFDKTGSGDADDADLSHRYLWGPGVDQLLADEQVSSLESAGEVLWAIADNQGSIKDVIDSNGDLRVHRVFDTFGNVVDETHYDTSGDPVIGGDPEFVDEVFAYTGRYFDENTGLQNNLNRWYDPSVGRWMSEDPIGFEAGDANLYRYVGNSPTNWIDPGGLAFIPGLPPERQPPGKPPLDFGGSLEVFPVFPPSIINPEILERDRIIDKANKWFEWYKKKGKGWPEEDCDKQALSFANRKFSPGELKYWKMRGLEGSRWHPMWPFLALHPSWVENENVVAFYPINGNTCHPFIIDTFHDYDNQKDAPSIYPEFWQFRQIWDGPSRLTWGVK